MATSFRWQSLVPLTSVGFVLSAFARTAANQGDLTFKKDVTFSGCHNNQITRGLDASTGRGGAVYQRVKGTMHFMGKLTMTDNEAYVYVSCSLFGGPNP